MDLTLDLGAARFPAAFVIAFGLSVYFTPIVRKAAFRYGVLDRPDGGLKHHADATPYLGGVAIYLAFLFALAFTYQFNAEILAILLGASIIVMIGLFDDLKVLGPGVKLAGQLVAAFVLIKAGVMIRLTFLPEPVALVLTVLWLVGVTNAINLIDVSDGLAAGVSAIAGMFLYIIALHNGAIDVAMLILSLVGAAVGFLAYNRPPARIFMGDTGSMFLGFMLASVAMIGHYTFENPVGALAPVVILGVPIFDTIFVMGARRARGLPVLRGSPDHFAVRMRNHGVSAGRIALVGYLVSAALGGAALGMCFVDLVTAVIVAGLVTVAGGGCAVALWRLGRGREALPRRSSSKSRALPRPEGPSPEGG